MYSYGYSYGYGLIGGNTYNPLINYDWSTTTAKEYKTDGVELVINGGFDTDSYWTKGTGWTIVNGVAIRTGVTSNSFVGQTITLTAGTTYKFTLDVNSIVGSGTIYLPSIAQIILTFSTIGTKTAYFTPNVTLPYIIGYYGTGTAELEIDNISIQKVIEEPNKRYLKDVGSTPTYNASMYFGRGAYLNGVDQTITVPINTTIQTSLKRVNGVVTINETSQTLTNYVISGLGVHKDYYLFTRLLTTSEKDSYINTPELFYAMAQADSTCVLNMPMCETSSTARNYRTGIDYPITNYTTSVRDNAKNLQYGLQTCKFVRDSLGVIQSASDYLEGDSAGYANTGWVPSADEDWTLQTVAEISGGSILYLESNTQAADKIRIIVVSDLTYTYVSCFNGFSKVIQGLNGFVEFVLRFNATTKQVDLFINKALHSSGIVTPVTSNLNMYLCARNYNGVTTDNFYNGAIQKFKVHNKALTNEEIQAL